MGTEFQLRKVSSKYLLYTMTVIKKNTTNAGEDIEKRERLHTAGGNTNWCSHYGKTVWRFLKKLKIELPHDQAISLLGIYSKKPKNTT